MDKISEMQKSFSKSIRKIPDQFLLEAIVDDGIPAIERLKIHRNTMAITLKASLKSVFPVVEQLVGDKFFDMLASAYLEKHPPTSGALIDWGWDFPAFIKSFTPARLLPYLTDVSKLEWAWHSCFHGPNSNVLTRACLADIPADKISNVRFSPPAHVLISSQYPIVKIWEANVRGMGTEETINLEEGGDKVLIIRPDLEVKVFKLDAGAFEILQGLDKGKTLIQAYDDAILLNPGLDLGAVLSFFMENQFLTSFSLE